MKTYKCVCGQIIFFQNVSCVNCHREIGFLPDLLWLTSLDPADNSLWRPTAPECQDLLYKKCQNYAKESVCNWMIPQKEGTTFCVSCSLNEIIPDLTDEQNRDLWARLEIAKRRLLYSLIQLKLPLTRKKDDPQNGVAFRFLSDSVNPNGTTSKVLTGHDEGIITVNVAEANDAMRETVRNAMKEPYRTLLGHFRHEIGHYYWDRLVRNSNFLEPFRELFGDERADYLQALREYYKSGAPPDWQDHYISAYSAAHPWEDWAETWAHFLHIQDVLEVANDFGLLEERILLDPLSQPREKPLGTPGDKRELKTDKLVPASFEEVIVAWAEFAVALNSVNRSMGLPDLYPFVLCPPVVAKLRFIYDVIAANSVVPALQNSRSA
jgi:hypothetical protein